MYQQHYQKSHYRLICLQHQSLFLLNVEAATIRRTISDIKVISITLLQSFFSWGLSSFLMALVLLLLRRTQQNSQGWYFAWENLQEVFAMLVVVVVVFPHWRFLRFRATFPCHRHSTRLLRLVKVSTGFELYPGCFWLLYFLPGFFVTVLPLALRFWVGIFYPQTFFTLRSFTDILSRFVT